MACEDLRHVCGGCGFKWPERAAYDTLTLESANLRADLATLRVRCERLEAVVTAARLPGICEGAGAGCKCGLCEALAALDAAEAKP